MLRWLRVLLTVCLLWAHTGDAANPLLTLGAGPPQYVGPGDLTSGASFYLGMQPYSSAKYNAAQVVRLRRSSDNAEADYGFSGGYLDQAAIAAWGGVSASGTGSITLTALTFTGGVIGGQVTGTGVVPGTVIVSGVSGAWVVNISQTVASTTLSVANALFVTTLYDQSGNGKDGVQATAGSQPVFLLNTLGSKLLPAVSGLDDSVSAGRFLTVTLAGSVAQPIMLTQALNVVSVAVVGIHSDVSASRNLVAHTAANRISLNSGSSLTGVTVDFTAFTYVGLGSGVSSVLNISGTETTGNAGTTAIGPILNILSNAGGTTRANAHLGAIGLWGANPDATTRANQTANMKAWWGIP